MLRVAEQTTDIGIVDAGEDQPLALLARLDNFGKAPARAEPAARDQRQDTLALPELGVELLLTQVTGLEAGFTVEVEEEAAVLLVLKPRLQPLGPSFVGAAVADDIAAILTGSR